MQSTRSQSQSDMSHPYIATYIHKLNEKFPAKNHTRKKSVVSTNSKENKQIATYPVEAKRPH